MYSSCDPPLTRANTCSHYLHTGFAGLEVLEALVSGFLHALLARDDLLDGGEDGAPVLEDGEGHVFARAVSDEVCLVGFC